jgi:hypothetical protein
MTGKTYRVDNQLLLPKGTAVVSVLIGDDTALGYGSQAAQVRRWSSEDATLTYGKTWDKWMSGAGRDTVTDDGAALIAITRGQGNAAADVGLEYPIAAAMEARYAGAEGPETPDCVVIKYATASAVATPSGTTAKSWHPVVTGGALDIFTDGYLTPCLAHLRATYAEVVAERIYISLGSADSTLAGSAEAFAANLAAIIREVRAAFSTAVPLTLIVPPLVDRTTHQTVDLVRSAWAILGHDYVDADMVERGGLGAGATPLDAQINGQGIIDLGVELATQPAQVRSIR